MRFFLHFGVAVLILVSLFSAPKTASAQIGPPPFGGRVVFLLPCANASIYTIVINFYTLGIVPLPLIWTPATLTSVTPPLPSIPPFYPGEQILGTFDIPWVCYIPPFTFLFGFRMQTERGDLPPL